jgi:hypothetical protein
VNAAETVPYTSCRTGTGLKPGVNETLRLSTLLRQSPALLFQERESHQLQLQERSFSFSATVGFLHHSPKVSAGEVEAVVDISLRADS